MNLRVKTVIVFLLVAIIAAMEVRAQGPPINTDTPIMLGLQGRGVRTFGKIVRKATLLQDGEAIPDPMERSITAWIVPVAIPYNVFSDKFQIGAVVPFMTIDADSRQSDAASSGIGDVRLFAKYLVYQFDRKGKTIRLAAKAGVKLPTGDDEKQPALGTGSTDYFFSAVAGWIESRVGVYVEGIYHLNTSRGAIDFGNSVFYNLALSYRLLPVVYETYPSPQLNGYLEINGSTRNHNSINRQQDDNSGGSMVFLSPGIQYVGGRRWLVEASVQIPLIDEPNGTQLGTEWTLSLGARVLIF